MQNVLEFFGRFHPLLVHLPIGILLISALFLWLDRWSKMSFPPDVISLSLGLGALSAVASVISGLLLENSGDYSGSTIFWHKALGITVAGFSILLWLLVKGDWISDTMLRYVLLLFVTLISVTGHLGGTLTHGKGYIAEPLAELYTTRDIDFTSINADSAIFYRDVVQTIFDSKCISCHGPDKQKGKLRLDSREAITKGGEDGKVIDEGNSHESELMKRIELPLDHEDHMPPREKRQLTSMEQQWIRLWIQSGADYNKKIAELISKDEIQTVLDAGKAQGITDVPEEEADAVSAEQLEQFTENGIAITPLGRESNYLQASFISIPKQASAVLPSLTVIKEQLLWLNLSYTEVNDESMKILKDFKNLRRLHLTRTQITDESIKTLAQLPNLNFINLDGTNVTLAGLQQLSEMKSLKSLFLFEVKLTEEEREQLKRRLPKVNIEFGGYEVPLLPDDTVVVKPAKS